MPRLLFLFALTAAAYLWPAGALAQTKLSGTCIYKPDEQHLLVVGDHEGHALGLGQGKCSWTKPIDFGGDEASDGVATSTIDAEGRTARYNGVLVVTTRGGSRVSILYRGIGVSKKRDSESSYIKGTFTLGDGIGKLKGATGKGSFTCTLTPEGTICDLDGEYLAGK